MFYVSERMLDFLGKTLILCIYIWFCESGLPVHKGKFNWAEVSRSPGVPRWPGPCLGLFLPAQSSGGLGHGRQKLRGLLGLNPDSTPIACSPCNIQPIIYHAVLPVPRTEGVTAQRSLSYMYWV